MQLKSIDGLGLEAAEHEASASVSAGTVLLVHGITADLNEGEMFARLADQLSAQRRVLRFSFRGHGGSGGTQEGMTIAGEMLDLQSAVSLALDRREPPLDIVASSFGAVSTCLSLPYIEDHLRRLVLWNPVLNLTRTFTQPELPWGRFNFGHKGQASLATNGYLLIDDEFRLGRVCWQEMHVYDPYAALMRSNLPALIIHGDADQSVPYDVSKQAASERRRCELVTILGSDHGFDDAPTEQKAIDATVHWLESDRPE